MGRSDQVLIRIDLRQPSIVWLDYDHELAKYVLDDLDRVCDRSESGSIVAVTLDAQTDRLNDPKTIKEEERETWPKKRIEQLKRLVTKLHFRGSRGEGNQVLEERPQFAVLGAVRQSGQELFSQHFSGNRTPPVRM